jgi:class 3 adenylate cyclase
MQADREGNLPLALDRAGEAVTLAGRTTLGMDAGVLLGKLQIEANQQSAATATLTGVRTLADELKASRHAAAAIHLLALLARRRGQFDEGLALLEESPCKTAVESPSAETGQWWHYRGLLLADRGDLASGERHLFRAHQVYTELHHAQGQAEVCDSLANLLLRRGKAEVALIFAQESLTCKQARQDYYGQAISHGTLGRAYLAQARYEEARKAFAENLRICSERLKNDFGRSLALNGLGQVAYLQKDFDRAQAHFQESLAVNPSRANAARAQQGLARVYLEMGQTEKAAAACEQIEHLLSQDGTRPFGLRESLVGLRGILLGRAGQTRAAEPMLREAIDGLRRLHLLHDTVPLLYELRDLLHAEGRTAEAVQTMAQALELLHDYGAEQAITEQERWLQSVDSGSMTRLALLQHLPDFVVQGVLAGGLRRVPSRTQEVAILFSDIRDYTTMSEGLSADEVFRLLNEWFTEATRVVHRHNGIVDKFIGDAIMAVFGVPEERDDAAADAVRAALDLREELATFNLRQKLLKRRTIRIGVGIDVGKVEAGFLGSHRRQSYTVIGDAVNVASRLEGATKERKCDILISGEVQERQEKYQAAETGYEGKIEVKGRKQPVEVFRVIGRRQGM